MTVTTAEAEQQVESSRHELDRTVEALKDKMTPGELFREARHAMGGAGDQLIAKVIDQAKENPMPFAVMGLGLAWLASSAKSQRQNGDGVGYRTAYGAGDGQGGAPLFDKAQDAASDAAERAGDAFSASRDKVSASAAAAMDQARGAAAGAAQSAQDMGRKARDAASDLFDREPLLIGAIGLVAGLALGAAPPTTEVEKEALAPVRETAKSVLEDQIIGVRETVGAVYGSAKEELQIRAQAATKADKAGSAETPAPQPPGEDFGG